VVYLTPFQMHICALWSLPVFSFRLFLDESAGI
jgi:hypothetical protein